jgi:uncharacterized membrane protein
MFRISDVPREPCSTGMDQAVAVLLIYLFGWVSGLVFVIIEKRNRFVRVNAMQSILLSAGWIGLIFVLSILGRIPLIGFAFWIISFLIGVAMTALLVVLIVLSFKNKRLHLPVVGDLAESWSGGDQG